MLSLLDIETFPVREDTKCVAPADEIAGVENWKWNE
jgi:hypothetical protein